MGNIYTSVEQLIGKTKPRLCCRGFVFSGFLLHGEKYSYRDYGSEHILNTYPTCLCINFGVCTPCAFMI